MGFFPPGQGRVRSKYPYLEIAGDVCGRVLDIDLSICSPYIRVILRYRGGALRQDRPPVAYSDSQSASSSPFMDASIQTSGRVLFYGLGARRRHQDDIVLILLDFTIIVMAKHFS